MEPTRVTHAPVRKSVIWTAAILLLGVVLLGAGYFGQNKIAFYVGLLVTLAGILIGIVQIVVRGNT